MPSASPLRARWGRQGAIFGVLVLALALAWAPRAPAAVTSQTITGSAIPSDQQPVTRGPVELSIGTDTTYDAPASPTPGLTEWEFHVENDFLFSTAGLSECPSGSPSSSQTTSQAIAACGTTSRIGSGTATFTGSPPCTAGCAAVVTVFNTPFVSPQFAAIAMHMYVSAANTAAIARLGLVTSPLMDDFAGGTRFRMSGGGLPIVPGIAMTELDVTLGNQPEAHDDNYVTARCGDSDETWNFAGAFNFDNVQNFSPTDTAPCEPVGNTLTAAMAGDGAGTVTSTPAGIACPGDCSQTYETDPGPVVLKAAPVNDASTFDGWNTCPGTVSTTDVTDDTCTVTVDADKTATATFGLDPDAKNLTVNKEGAGGGTVTSDPGGIDCGSTCVAPFPENEPVTLTASPSTGSSFGGWTSCPGATPTPDTCQLTMDADKSATASFAPQHLLTVSKTGSGFGTVTSAPGGINCGSDCTESFDENEMVTLTATPTGGSAFSGWSGGGCSGTGTCQVTMDAAKSAIAGFAPGPASFVVDSTANDPDLTTNGVCEATGSVCTLRAAIAEANATPTIPDTITFSVTGTHAGVFPSFQITSPMTITGNGSAPGQTAITSNDQGSSLFVSGSSGQVTLRDLRVTNGRSFGVGTVVGPLPLSVRGGGIHVNGNQTTPPTLTLEDVEVTGNEVVAGGNDLGLGGGIFVGFFANLVLDDSTVSGNTVSGGTGQASTEGAGGGIFSVSPVSITDSTISDNSVIAGSVRSGGGIAGTSFAALNLVRSTVSGNSTGATGRGGGILMDSLDVTTITNSTVSGNTAGTGGGGGAVLGSTSSSISASTFAGNSAPGGVGSDAFAILGQTTVKSSIFGSPAACAVSGSGSLASAGRNLDVGTSCGWGTGNGNLQSSDPLLGPLQNNGGPTETRALMAGSPAIDTGAAVDGAGTDQRGTSRPQGAGCDIGAFEVASAPGATACVATSIPIPPAQPPAGGGTPPKKKCKKGQKLKKGKCVKKKRKKKK